MPTNEIDRISMPSREVFFDEYVFSHRPVVITDLFDGQEIASITTMKDATLAWGAAQIAVQEEYSRAEGKAQPPQAGFMSLREYVDFTRANPSSRLCCTEYDTPARILASFRLPAAALGPPQPDEQEVFGLPKKYGDFDLATNTFVANPGNVAHLHFDGDQREVLLHQVYGRKRVILFPPSAAIHLRTLDGPATRPSLAGLYLEDMSLEQKLVEVERANGYHTVLEPGETIYIPMLMWHHLEYLDDAMSCSIRFGRTRIGRFLSLDHFHRDPYIQNVATSLAGPEDAVDGFDTALDEIKDAYQRPTSDVTQKVREIRTLFRALCAQRCPDASSELLCPPEREEEQIARIVNSNDLKGGLKYTDPALIARSRPVGPIGARRPRHHRRRLRAARLLEGRRGVRHLQPCRQDGPRCADEGGGRAAHLLPPDSRSGMVTADQRNTTTVHELAVQLVSYGESNSVESFTTRRAVPGCAGPRVR